jgi:3-oxoacyl-[acyl-carrier protein] reductase
VIGDASGRVVVVTGASRGIGRGVAEVFVRAGARVLLVGRDPHALRAAEDALAGLTGEAATLTADISSREACQAVAAEALRRWGRIDVLCANAGIYPAARLDTMTEQDLTVMMDTNLGGTVWAVQACLPALRESRRGRIVLTSSITGPVTGYPGWAHYGASKAAQLGFMRTAAIELARDGITINAVLPGNILTEGMQELGEDHIAEMTASIPMGRLGTVEDIGHAALFLASDEAGYITGQTIVVDGGQVLPESFGALGDD